MAFHFILTAHRSFTHLFSFYERQTGPSFLGGREGKGRGKGKGKGKGKGRGRGRGTDHYTLDGVGAFL